MFAAWRPFHRRSWRTVERHETGSLVGWLGLLQDQPIEHLRTADLTEALFIPAEHFLTLWEQESRSPELVC